MNIVFLLYRGNPYCGGQGVYLYHLSKELAGSGIGIDVIVGPPYPDPVDEWACVHKLENLNIWAVKTKDFSEEKLLRIFSPWNFIDYLLTRAHVFPEMETFSMRAFSLMKKLVEKKGFHLIHDINTLGWGNLPMKGFGIPVISTIHHPLTKDREADIGANSTLWQDITTVLFYPLVMQKMVINRLDRVITSFKGGVAELGRAYSLAADKISVVYNGIDTGMFRNTGEERDENSILFVGNTEDQKKGLIYLLEALRMLPENVRLTIVDEGPPLKLTATKLIDRLKLHDRVEFTGKVGHKKLLSLYSRAALLVMPSLFEGFGLPAVEAMACGTPVVVTDAGALCEVVDRDCGIVVPMKNPGELKSAMELLMKNRDMMKRMGIAGRSRVEKNFSWTVAAANTIKVYEDVLKNFRKKS